MSNKNYQAGVRFEREVMEDYKKGGFKVLRTAGSHGEYDVIAYGREIPPHFVQCKRVSTVRDAERMQEKWQGRENNEFFVQVLAVRIKNVQGIRYEEV